MNAAETLKQAAAAADQRAYEPSMEEILASIRRIIADDQSLPNRAFVREGEATLRAALDSPAHHADRDEVGPAMRGPFPVAPEPDASEPAAEPAASIANEPAPVAPRLVAASAHGHIAAPQYAMPDSPTLPAEARVEDGVGTFVPHPLSEAVIQPILPPEAVKQPESGIPQDASPRHSESDAASASDDAASVEPSSPAVHDRAAVASHLETDTMASLFSTATDQTVTAAFNTLAATRLVENDDALKDMVRDMIRPLLKDWLDDHLPTMVERLVRAEIERVARGGR